MFGSDWPVCLLAGSYEKTMSALLGAFGELEENSRGGIFGANAITCYKLQLSAESSKWEGD